MSWRVEEVPEQPPSNVRCESGSKAYCRLGASGRRSRFVRLRWLAATSVGPFLTAHWSGRFGGGAKGARTVGLYSRDESGRRFRAKTIVAIPGTEGSNPLPPAKSPLRTC